MSRSARRRNGWTLGLVSIGLVGVTALVVALFGPDVEPPAPSGLGPVPTVVEGYDPVEAPDDAPEAVLEAAPEQQLEDVAQELAGPRGVVCRLEPRVDGASARLLLDDDDGTWLAVAAAHAHVLVLSDVPEAGSGVLRIEGFSPMPVRWAAAREGAGYCVDDPIQLKPADAGVVGTVTGPPVAVSACGQPVTLDRDGDFYASADPDEPCAVEARRHFGVWEWVETIDVTPTRGRDAVVEIDAPPFDAVLPLVVADGHIRAVWDEDLPEPLVGARVITVDGASVPPSPDGFHLATGGQAGTMATIVVEAGGREQTVQMERRALSFEDWLVR